MYKPIKITLFCLIAFQSLKAQVCFGPEIITYVFDFSQGITSADFNNDGLPDVAVALGYIQNIQCLRGLGTGSFAPAALLGANNSGGYVTSGDFNNDGKMDVASNNNLKAASIFHGNGNFGFSPANMLNASNAWSAVWITNDDLNGDGKKDFIVANETTNNVSVIFSNGTVYGPTEQLFNVGIQPRCVVTGDFNGDGKKDIVTANMSGNNISLRTGNGLGGFAPAVSFPTDFNPGRTMTDDFNNDGKPDIIIANSGPNTATTTISLLLNNGQGGFNSPVNFYIGNYPYSVASADFNGDGNRDIVVAVTSNQKLAILLGNGLGNFSSPFYIPTANTPNFVITNDFNGDGHQDIAVSCVGLVSVLLNTTPIISITATPSLLCAGETATITVAGNDTYNWNTGQTTNSITVAPSTTTIYSVTATANSCTNSSAYTMNVNSCTGIQNYRNTTNFLLKVYPNPANKFFVIESQNEFVLSLTDQLGKLVRTLHLNDANNYKLEISGLGGGVYYLSGSSAAGNVYRKIIVN